MGPNQRSPVGKTRALSIRLVNGPVKIGPMVGRFGEVLLYLEIGDTITNIINNQARTKAISIY